jgi:hypothetical protein
MGAGHLSPGRFVYLDFPLQPSSGVDLLLERQMDLHQLRYFVAIAERLHFAEAAESVRVVQHWYNTVRFIKQTCDRLPTQAPVTSSH